MLSGRTSVMLLLMTFQISQILANTQAHCLDVFQDIHTFCALDYQNFRQRKTVTFFLHVTDLSVARWAMPVTSNTDDPSLFIRKAMEKFQGRGTSQALFLKKNPHHPRSTPTPPKKKPQKQQKAPKPNHKTKQK